MIETLVRIHKHRGDCSKVIVRAHNSHVRTLEVHQPHMVLGLDETCPLGE